ncbi:ABC transporter permease subunit [Suttonella sp. R2A3]|uniref:ABC transporter permease n=1 Tax=Suttonella sp. R2A3 TaxID=2908648 RepID=UPI001EE9DDB3|nr:ABC transporter permease subunit [Suttonella sp. R2A3]UJF24918.1 ABC transporter permease subunit [Suttonella sp. R2A3]
MTETGTSILLGYEHNLLEGALITLELSLGGLVLSLVIGIVACAMRLSGIRVLKWPSVFYTTVVRGVPDLVQLFLIYYGGQFLLNMLADKMGWGYLDMNPFISGIFTIGFIFGAYMSETFRGAILAIPHGQHEAATAYALSRWTTFRRITWPLMMRYALPVLGNNWLVLLKTTALVSVIGLNDLVGFANLAAKSTREPFLFYAASAVGFLVLTSLSLGVLWWLKRRYSLGFTER